MKNEWKPIGFTWTNQSERFTKKPKMGGVSPTLIANNLDIGVILVKEVNDDERTDDPCSERD